MEHVNQEDKIFFTADIHLGHLNSIKYGNRPFENINEMTNYFIKKLFELPKGSNLYCVGDLAFNKSSLEIVANEKPNYINFHIIIGNHDKFIENKSWEFLEKFSSISLYKIVKAKNQEFFLCHYPMISWDKSHYGSIQLFGHHHNDLNNNQKLSKVIPDIFSKFKFVNVGWDLWNWEFVNINQILEKTKDTKNWDFIEY